MQPGTWEVLGPGREPWDGGGGGVSKAARAPIPEERMERHHAGYLFSGKPGLIEDARAGGLDLGLSLEERAKGGEQSILGGAPRAG